LAITPTAPLVGHFSSDSSPSLVLTRSIVHLLPSRYPISSHPIPSHSELSLYHTLPPFPAILLLEIHHTSLGNINILRHVLLSTSVRVAGTYLIWIDLLFFFEPGLRRFKEQTVFIQRTILWLHSTSRCELQHFLSVMTHTRCLCIDHICPGTAVDKMILSSICNRVGINPSLFCKEVITKHTLAMDYPTSILPILFVNSTPF
jgi:hypothetical protein